MDFELIQIIREEKDIEMDERLLFIQNTDYLEVMESQEVINPFTGEKTMFHCEHAACYFNGSEKIGNIILEEGSLNATEVPRTVCEEIAAHFGAVIPPKNNRVQK